MDNDCIPFDQFLHKDDISEMPGRPDIVVIPPDLVMTPREALLGIGLSEFRGLQEDIINAIISGNDTFVLMATSGGKSLCYTIPALCFPKYTLIVSPLIALMDDQVQSLMERNIRAVRMSSEMSPSERDTVFDNLKGYNDDSRAYQIVMVSPEFLSTDYAHDILCRFPPSQVAFDEAHCISAWGKDFRREYSKVGAYLDRIENVLCSDIRNDETSRTYCPIVRVALTATASQDVINDILKCAGIGGRIQSLQVSRPKKIIASSLERRNISITVRPRANQSAIDDDIIADIRYLLSFEGCGIVYCRRRIECERLKSLLTEHGISVAAHHGDMSLMDRRNAAKTFMSGAVRVMIATIGFGMGIDKPDVRFVIHNGVSASPEAWYQEMGRGGRDGRNAIAITYILPGYTDIIRRSSLLRDNGWDMSRRYAACLSGQKCRMKSVLSCFGEETSDCGICDICTRRGPQNITPGNHDMSHILEFQSKIRKMSMAPARYAPLMTARKIFDENKGARFMESPVFWEAMIDVFFVDGLIDYDYTFIPDIPPLCKVIPARNLYHDFYETAQLSLSNSFFETSSVTPGSGISGNGNLDTVFRWMDMQAATCTTLMSRKYDMTERDRNWIKRNFPSPAEFRERFPDVPDFIVSLLSIPDMPKRNIAVDIPNTGHTGRRIKKGGMHVMEL